MCLARLPVSLGVWGLNVCSLDLAFTTATVRNLPREGRMAVPMVSFAKMVIFGGFKRRVASFRVAGVAFRDIQTCFVTCRKSLCVADAILLRRFQKIRCSFRGRRSTLDVSIVILRGRRSTLDVSCCVFFANRILRAASSGDKVQIPWQAWHFVRCDENWRKPRTKHRFWGSKFEVHKKTRRKTSILKLQIMKIGGSLARNARFDAPTRLVSSLWFSCGLAVSKGEAAKPLLFEGFQAGCDAVLRGRCGTLWHSNLFDNVSKVVLCGRHNTFVSFSQDESQLSWKAQHFGDLHRHFAWQAQHFRRVALRALHSTLRTLHSTLYPLHFTLHILYSTLYTLHSLHSTLYTPHFTLHSLHSTLYTLYSTLHTWHSALYSLHSTLYTLHSTLCAPNFTLYTLHSTLYTRHSTLYTLHFTLHTLHSTLYTLPFTFHTLHSTLYTPHSTLHTHTSHSTLHTVHSTLYTVHSTLYTPHFTLHMLHSTLHTLHSTLFRIPHI